MRRALVVEGPGRLALLERASLEPERAKSHPPAFCGLCGTDVEFGTASSIRRSSATR